MICLQLVMCQKKVPMWCRPKNLHRHQLIYYLSNRCQHRMPGVVLCCIFLRTKSTTEGCESISFEYKLLYSSHYATSGFVELDISPVFNKARKANAIVLERLWSFFVKKTCMWEIHPLILWKDCIKKGFILKKSLKTTIIYP